jgi:hypothetical protein
MVGFIVPTLVLIATLFLCWDSPYQLIAVVIGSKDPVTTDYEIDGSGIRIRQRGQELMTDWSTVVGFQCTPDRMKLVLDPPGIIVIPTRAFTTEQQRRDWIEKIHCF